MTDSIAHVRPGDLIRAEDFNTILDQLTDLATRVALLEGGTGDPNAPKITSFTPALPKVGEEMRILGSNFGFSVGGTRLKFDNTLVTAFKLGTNDNELIFEVPEIPGLPPGGRTVLLQLSNLRGTTQRTLTMLPRPPIFQGTINLLYDGPQPETPAAGQNFDLRFRLDSDANLPATMTVTATVSVAGWPLQVLNGDGSPNSTRQFIVNAGQNIPFAARVQVPAGTATGTAFTVSVRADGPGITVDGGTRSFTVGQAAPVPDPNIEAKISGSSPPAPWSNQTNTLTLARGGFAELIIDSAFRAAGTYDVTLTTVSGWQLSADNEHIVIQPGQIGGDGTAKRVFSIFVTATQSAVPGDLVIKLQRQGSAQSYELPTVKLRVS